MVKFAANNNKSASIKLYPFFTLKGLYLYISFDGIDFSDIITRKRVKKRKTMDISKVI